MTNMTASKPRPTLKDVAQHAGVSQQSVSLVINGKNGVSEATRQRVQASIRQLGYVPTASARALRGSSTRTLAVVYPGTRLGRLSASGYLEEILNGVCWTANQQGFHVLLHPLSLDHTPERFQAFQQEGRVEGLISVISDTEGQDARIIAATTLPTVSVQRPLAGAYSVRADNRGGMRLAMEHLLAQGHRRIAHLGAGTTNYASLERFEGYREGLLLGGLSFDPALVRHVLPPQVDQNSSASAERQPLELAAATQLALDLLSQADPPTALTCFSDLYAVGALQAARELKLRIPEDLAVVGFNDFTLAAVVDPPLTTVRFPAFTLGQMSADVLLKLLSGETPQVNDLVLSLQLIKRESG